MKVGTVCYATTQGLGYLAKDFYDHGVIQEVMIFRHPHGDRTTHVEWYPPGTPVLTGRNFLLSHRAAVAEFLDRIDVCLFFETPFDWSFADLCRRQGIKTVLMPMYEWFPERPAHRFDLYLCPSDLDLDIFRDQLQLPSIGVPVPVRTDTWRLRTRARRFLHNAGHVGSRNHKGTDVLLAATEFVESPIDLTIRCQDPRLMAVWLRRYEGDYRLRFQVTEVPYNDLFGPEHDVYVAPERYNGLSLPLQEAFAAGMPVITTDRYPANTWLPNDPVFNPDCEGGDECECVRPLVPVSRTERVRVAPGYLEIDESVVEPRDLAWVIDGIYDQDVTELSNRGREWAERNSWDVLGPEYKRVLEALCQDTSR